MGPPTGGKPVGLSGLMAGITRITLPEFATLKYFCIAAILNVLFCFSCVIRIIYVVLCFFFRVKAVRCFLPLMSVLFPQAT